MRIWLPIAAAAVLLATLMWTGRARLVAPRHVHVTDQPTTGAEVPPAGVPIPVNCSTPLSLDAKIILHLVPLPESRTGCRIEFRARENPFAGDEVYDGDVITEVGCEPMSTQVALGLVHRLELAGQTGIALTVLRKGETRHVIARVAP